MAKYSQTTVNELIISDLKLFGKSWKNLPKEQRNQISAEAPEFSKAFTFNHEQTAFSIEFSALRYDASSAVLYAYRLDGVDEHWVYADDHRPFAYYNHLRPGTYTFRLKANAGRGGWVDAPHTLKVRVLPPPWKTAWAYALYVLAVLAGIALVFRSIRNRFLLRNEIRLQKLQNEKQEELNHAKLQFFTNITHELLTPLAIISAAVDNQRQGRAGEDYTRIIADNCNRLIRLIQQILEFRKVETDNLKLRVSKGNLVKFLRDSVDSIRPFADKHHIRVGFACEEDDIPAYFDPDKVDKMVYNLLSNAIKYNRVEGTVQVSLSLCGTADQVLFAVTDTGQGMDSRQLSKLFSSFYDGEYRRHHTTGTGIGLALTKSLVKLHHGSINVNSILGQGTTFEIRLPIHREAFADDEVDEELIIRSAPSLVPIETAGNTSASEIGGQEPDVRHYTLLIAEDEPELRHLMKNLLEVDYQVQVAANGVEAWKLLKENNVDLVISDVMMPEMDGIEFCKIIKNDADTCDIPVILLTAKNQQNDRIEAYDSGANAFISKPFNLSVLHSRINNLLKTREQMNHNFKKQFVFEAKELEYTSMDEDFLQRAFACINAHLDDADYSQNDFVNDMAVSRSTAFRKLKSLTGMTYTDFVKNVRLKAACRMMEEKKNIRISELAYAVGFSDPKYFSVCFKKEFGMKPSEYMQGKM